jgi:serine/threonine protein kinase/Tfp pilus assembly protein PilF
MHPTAPGIETILARAVEITAPGERQAFVERACAGDAELQRRVERLVERHFQAGSFLEQPAVDLAAEGPTVTQHSGPAYGPGTVLGPYRLLELLGEGGMGLVYVAEQERPLRRRVALKLIKPGMDSQQVVARFEAERQALALMDHPHIARVHDGGTTPEGRPYFVMELVRGTPITDYCDAHRLTTRRRLELFLDVCHAVQHAHQKGVIHRDLKPSNVLVSHHDVRAVVKVIDFGVAKATGQRLTDRSLYTGFAQMIGTPLYMSPEQAGLSDLDVDTRSDVYSLGVLLYKLLTATTPFDQETLEKVSYDEMRRMIREDEPPRPSTRLSTLKAEHLSTVADRRGAQPRNLSMQLRGELDWVVMKALEKDRNRRYESASAFAADVRHYLDDEPVQACPPSAAYRLRKYVRRHKAGLTGAACSLFVLVVAGAALWRDLGQRAAAEASVQVALERADSLLQQERWQAASVVLTLAREQMEGRRLGSLLQRVEQSLRDVDMLMNLEEARVQMSVSNVGTRFDYAGADRLYTKAFRGYGLDMKAMDPAAAAQRVRSSAIRDSLTAALEHWTLCLGWNSEGGKALQAVLRLADGDPWRQRLHDALNRADQGALQEIARQQNTLSKSPEGLFTLAVSLGDSGHWAAADPLLRQAQALHPANFWINFELATALISKKPTEPEQAARFYQAALALRPESALAHLRLGRALRAADRLAEAESEYRKAIALKPEFSEAHFDLGNVLMDQGKLAEAQSEVRSVIDLQPGFAEAHALLGLLLLDEGKPVQAEAACRKAVSLGPKLADCHSALAMVLVTHRGFNEAMNEFRAALRVEPDDAVAHNSLAWLLATCPDVKLRDYTLALAHAHKAFKLAPGRHVGAVWNTLGVAHYRNRDWRAAIEALMKSVQFRRGGNSTDFFFLAMSHWRLNETGKARAWYDRGVAWMDEHNPQDEELKRFRAEAAALLSLANDAAPAKKP